MIRLILLDDHALIRRGMRDALSAETDLQIVAEAAHQDELHIAMQHHACDVLVLDINLPGVSGLDILARLQLEHPQLRTLVVSMYPEDQYAVKSLRAGAWGYVNKSADTATLVEAIRSVAQGHKFITPSIANLLVEGLGAKAEAAPHERLSDIEMQTLLRVASGRKLTEIAEELQLSPKTVSVYRARLLEKMKLSSNAELAHYAVKHGLMT